MARGNGQRHTGCIRWPTDLHNTGEGGMSVYAVVPETPCDGWAGMDSFITCSPGMSIQAVACETCVDRATDVALWPLSDHPTTSAARSRCPYRAWP